MKTKSFFQTSTTVHASEAEKVFRKIKSAATLRTWNDMFLTFAKRGMVWKFRDYLDDMREHSLQPDPSTFSIMIDAYIHIQELQLLSDTLTEMEDLGVAPDAYSCIKVLHFMCDQGENALCLKFFRSLEAKGVRRNLSMYNVALQAQAVSGEPSDVVLANLLALVEEMKDLRPQLHPDKAAYTVLFDAYQRTQQQEGASPQAQDDDGATIRAFVELLRGKRLPVNEGLVESFLEKWAGPEEAGTGQEGEQALERLLHGFGSLQELKLPITAKTYAALVQRVTLVGPMDIVLGTSASPLFTHARVTLFVCVTCQPIVQCDQK